MPTFQDLAGFWDLLCASIEDVTPQVPWSYSNSRPTLKLLEPKVGRSLQAKSPDPGKCPSSESVGRGEEGKRRDPGQPRQPWTGDGDLYDHPGSLPSARFQGVEPSHHCLSCKNPFGGCSCSLRSEWQAALSLALGTEGTFSLHLTRPS